MVEREGADKGGFCYRETEPVEDMACIMVYGPYENIGLSYHAFACWMEEHRQYENSRAKPADLHIVLMNLIPRNSLQKYKHRSGAY